MGELMKGRRGVVMGVANNRSIAWGIANRLASEGAELALAYQPAMERRIRPLAESIGCEFLVPCDVSLETDADEPAALDRAFAAVADKWPTIDFLVHAIAFSDRNELTGRYADTSRRNFVNTMVISCFSFTEAMRRAAPLMKNGGSAITLTYIGSDRALPNYNVMGVAKAALESSVRYLAVDFGKDNIRVNAISAGPIRTAAASGIARARTMYDFQKRGAPLRRSVSTAEIGGSAVYLLSDLSSGVTGEVHFVDSGFNIVAMPPDEKA
jgi:enoyl-[acyl-carrier protein] reductase I